MTNVEIVHQKILEFLTQVGMPELKAKIPLNVEYNPAMPVAYTSATGIWISERVIDNCPEEAAIYFAHEVFHHVIDEHRVWEYTPILMNYAQDYRINYLIYKIFGYDVRKTHFKGLFSARLGKMTVEKIAQELASKNNLTSLGAACGHIGSSHPDIVKLANHIRTKYNIGEASAKKDIIYFDADDEEAYEESGLGEAVSSFRLNFDQVKYPIDVSLLSRSLFGMAFKTKPIARKTYGELTIEEALVSGFLGARLKTSETVGDARLSAASVLFYLRNIARHREVIDSNISWNKERISITQKRMNSCMKEITSITGEDFEAEEETDESFTDEDLENEDLENDDDDDVVQRPVKNVKMKKSVASMTEEERSAHVEKLRQAIDGYKSKIRNHKKWVNYWSGKVEIQKLIVAETLFIKPEQQSSAVTIKTRFNRDRTLDFPILGNKIIRSVLYRMCVTEERIERVKKISKEIDNLESAFDGLNKQPQGQAIGGNGEPSLEEILGVDSGSGGPGSESREKLPGGQPGPGGDQAGKTSGTTRATRKIVDNLRLYESIMFYMQEFDTVFNSVARSKPDENRIDIENMLSLGSDLNRISSSELAYLSNPNLRMLFFSKLANSSLLQYVPRENRREAVSIMVDCSGSMMTNARYPIAAGFALSMMKKIIKDQRGFNLIMFDTRVVDCIVYDVEKGLSHSIDEIFMALCNPSQGGTCFVTALNKAIDVKEEYCWSNMTGILVSDGEDYINDYHRNSISDRMGKSTKFSAVITSGSTSGVTSSQIFSDISRTRKLDDCTVSLVKAGTSVL